MKLVRFFVRSPRQNPDEILILLGKLFGLRLWSASRALKRGKEFSEKTNLDEYYLIFVLHRYNSPHRYIRSYEYLLLDLLLHTKYTTVTYWRPYTPSIDIHWMKLSRVHLYTQYLLQCRWIYLIFTSKLLMLSLYFAWTDLPNFRHSFNAINWMDHPFPLRIIFFIVLLVMCHNKLRWWK